MDSSEAGSWLQTADWVIIFLYLSVVIGLGFHFGKGQNSTKDYFLGNRNIHWWGVSFSILATETSALTFLGIPAVAYAGDLSFIQIIIGYVIARLILAVVMVPLYFKKEVYSPYQLFSDAFGISVRRLAGGFFLISGTLAAGVRVYITCIPIQLMLDLSILSSIYLFVILSLVYTYIGGIKAVIWTDAMQFFILIFGGAFALYFINGQMDEGLSGMIREGGRAGKLDWLSLDFSLTMPENGMPYNVWMGIIGATFHVASSHGVDQLIVQRVLTCRTENDGRKALWLSAALILPVMLLFLLVGTSLWYFYGQHPLKIPLPETENFTKNDYIFPIFILTEMPSGFKGVLIVGILSAAMSSVSSALSALASVSVMDFFKPFDRKQRGELFYFKLSRWTTLFWGGVLVLVAYLSRELEFVLNAAFKLAGLTSGAMLGAMLLVLIYRKGSAAPVLMGMSASFLCMIGISIGASDQIAWPWFTMIGTVVCVLVSSFCRKLQSS